MLKYQTVIFDLFGTLVPYIGEEEFKLSLLSLSHILEVELAQIHEVWLTKERYYKAITEYDSTYNRVKDLAKELGVEEERKIKHAVKNRLSTHAEWLIPFQNTINTLEVIKANNITVGLISDCSAEVNELWETTSLAKYVDVSLFSCMEKMNKSKLDIFKWCCERLERKAEEIIYIGDSIGELEKAKELGMKPILKKTRKNLQWGGDTIADLVEILVFLDVKAKQ